MHTLSSIFLYSNLASAMDTITPPKEYKVTLSDVAKARIIIEAITRAGGLCHVTVKASHTGNLEIEAMVAAKDVELQEKQFTETQFLPLLIDQTPETITLKPFIPGLYTLFVPAEAHYEANPHQTVLMVADLRSVKTKTE